jgi:hypothetical protein
MEDFSRPLFDKGRIQNKSPAQGPLTHARSARQLHHGNEILQPRLNPAQQVRKPRARVFADGFADELRRLCAP